MKKIIESYSQHMIELKTAAKYTLMITITITRESQEGTAKNETTTHCNISKITVKFKCQNRKKYSTSYAPYFDHPFYPTGLVHLSSADFFVKYNIQYNRVHIVVTFSEVLTKDKILGLTKKD